MSVVVSAVIVISVMIDLLERVVERTAQCNLMEVLQPCCELSQRMKVGHSALKLCPSQ